MMMYAAQPSGIFRLPEFGKYIITSNSGTAIRKCDVTTVRVCVRSPVGLGPINPFRTAVPFGGKLLRI